MKDTIYPDDSYEKDGATVEGVSGFIFLEGCWLAPYCLVRGSNEAPNWLIALAILLYSIGNFLHFCSDAQKYFVLKERKSLMTNGFFAICSHTNYLGEVLMYSGIT